ncbi:MAG TPA: pantoate--beta-alanine ligase [Arenibacter sp.]|nr:pantoate--beta-alanine ligase [Arenibacter sp.]
MQLINTKKELRSLLTSLDKNKSLGLVPTMGALHLGHISLVEQSLKENDITLVSIFVNPTQFNNNEDLAQYPKTLDRDISLLRSVSRDVIVFAPTPEEIYSGEILSKSYDFGGLENKMEGKFREGHFNGVGTIVEILLTLIDPTRAYFGEKDFQQLQIIRKMVRTQGIPVEIIGCPIVREPSGLAMSSRNERLSDALKKEAAFIYSTLQGAKKEFGMKSADFVVDWVRKQFEAQQNFKLEYITIVDENNLGPVIKKEKGTNYRAFIAVYIGDVRLIDNIAL